MTQGARKFMTAAICLAAVGALAACSSVSGPRADTERAPGQSRDPDSNRGGDGGFFGFGGGGNSDNAPAEAALGVNSFLWRASLDTLAFMPLASADSTGGVIITDWYADPTVPGERFKATVYILDTRLRADALNVSIFRQTQQGGAWTDAAVDPATAIQIENAILRRAREIRLSTIGE